MRASQAAAARGQVAKALADTNTAQAIEPGAASPYLQRALVLEQANDISGASAAIKAAVAREPTDYKLWLTAERIANGSGPSTAGSHGLSACAGPVPHLGGVRRMRTACKPSYDRAMRFQRIVLVLVVVGSLGLAPAAAAKKTTFAPPGKAGTSEYAETLPAEAGGNVAPPAGGRRQPHRSRALKTGLRQGRSGQALETRQGRAVGGGVRASDRTGGYARDPRLFSLPLPVSSSITADERDWWLGAERATASDRRI